MQQKFAARQNGSLAQSEQPAGDNAVEVLRLIWHCSQISRERVMLNQMANGDERVALYRNARHAGDCRKFDKYASPVISKRVNGAAIASAEALSGLAVWVNIQA